MTREEAKRNLEDLREYKIVLSDIPFNDQKKICDLAISALSTDGEYIKKEDLFERTINRNSAWNTITDSSGWGLEEIVNDLPTYSFPETAKPEEGAELIDRRQIKWYGCDHEGYIKGINCDTADCSKCFYATVEHDEVMSLPVYRIPDPAENKGEWIPVSERLPKTADVYRVTRYYPNNVMNPKYLVDACAFDGSDTWYDDNRINHERAYVNNVIAWQENPEPYKAESEETE